MANIKKHPVLTFFASLPYIIWLFFGVLMSAYNYLELHQVIALGLANLVIISLILATLDDRISSKVIAAIMLAIIAGYLIIESKQQHSLFPSSFYMIFITFLCGYYILLNILSLRKTKTLS